MTSEMVRLVLVVVASYLMGSLPTAYLVARFIKRVNIFEVGSGNMGGTNVARAMGVKWGIVVFIVDGIKGMVAVVLATHVIMPENYALAAAVAASAAVIGHNWSFFVALLTGRLRGGKGASTAFGTMMMIAPLQVFAVMCVIGALLIAITRYVSLAVLVMFGIAAVWMFILIQQQAVAQEYGLYSAIITALIIFRFRENIQRLIAGTERRLGDRA